jgi:hypothetical protein
MPAELLLDTVDGSEFDVSTAATSNARGGLVTGISGDPSTAIDQVFAAAAAKGFSLGKPAVVNGQSAFLQRIAGRAASSDSFRVQLFFGTDGSFAPSAYVITDRSYTQAYQSNRIPGTRERILIPKWTDDQGLNAVPADMAMVTWQYPMRQIEVSGMKYGSPPDDSQYAGKIAHANQEQFLGLGPGYWYVNGASTVASKYSGYYSYNASAVTKTIEDWAELFTLYSHLVNKYVDLDPELDQRVRAATYKYGVIDKDEGLLKVGPFPLTSFAALFGFTSSPGGGQPSFLNNPLGGGGSHQ